MSRKARLYIGITCAIIGYVIFAPAFPALAAFNPNRLISDVEFTDVQAMDLTGIQRFLERRSGILKHARFIDIDGTEHSASEIIFRAARAYGINPQVILVTLQKEQSLLENSNPSLRDLDWAMGYAVCDDCATNDPGIQKYRGFAQQVDYAAARLRQYLDTPEKFGWVKTAYMVPIDSRPIIPQTDATRALYLYTPHLHGNEKFWTLWNTYFAKLYPDGTVVQPEGDKDVWLIDNGKRRRFESYSVFLSHYDPSRLLAIAPSDLERYEEGTPIRLAQYSLVRSPKGTVYLIVDNHKRGFVSREALRRLGFAPFEIEDVGFDALDDYPDGEPITVDSDHPGGILLQNKTNGAVFFVQDGVKFPLKAREILRANFPYQKPKAVTPAALAAYPEGVPLGFNDGVLLQSPSAATVYIVSNRVRRPFVSEEVFTALGFKWDNVVKVSPALLELHNLGTPIDFPPIPESTLVANL